jgi:hypothetical protein
MRSAPGRCSPSVGGRAGPLSRPRRARRSAAVEPIGPGRPGSGPDSAFLTPFRGSARASDLVWRQCGQEESRLRESPPRHRPPIADSLINVVKCSEGAFLSFRGDRNDYSGRIDAGSGYRPMRPGPRKVTLFGSLHHAVSISEWLSAALDPGRYTTAADRSCGPMGKSEWCRSSVAREWDRSSEPGGWDGFDGGSREVRRHGALPGAL